MLKTHRSTLSSSTSWIFVTMFLLRVFSKDHYFFGALHIMFSGRSSTEEHPDHAWHWDDFTTGSCCACPMALKWHPGERNIAHVHVAATPKGANRSGCVSNNTRPHCLRIGWLSAETAAAMAVQIRPRKRFQWMPSIAWQTWRPAAARLQWETAPIRLLCRSERKKTVSKVMA